MLTMPNTAVFGYNVRLDITVDRVFEMNYIHKVASTEHINQYGTDLDKGFLVYKCNMLINENELSDLYTGVVNIEFSKCRAATCPKTRIYLF